MAAKKPRRSDEPDPCGNAVTQMPASGISAAAAGGAALAAGAADGGGISGGAIAGAAAAPSPTSAESHIRVDPTAEHAYWQVHYRHRPYAAAEDVEYEELAPAYQHGWEAFSRYGRTATGEAAKFEDVEPQLRQDWQAQQRDRQLAWEIAQQASRDAWERVQAAMVGQSQKPSAR